MQCNLQLASAALGIQSSDVRYSQPHHHHYDYVPVAGLVLVEDGASIIRWRRMPLTLVGVGGFIHGSARPVNDNDMMPSGVEASGIIVDVG